MLLVEAFESVTSSQVALCALPENVKVYRVVGLEDTRLRRSLSSNPSKSSVPATVCVEDEATVKMLSVKSSVVSCLFIS